MKIMRPVLPFVVYLHHDTVSIFPLLVHTCFFFFFPSLFFSLLSRHNQHNPLPVEMLLHFTICIGPIHVMPRRSA